MGLWFGGDGAARTRAAGSGLLDHLDALQQRHPVLAVPVAVVAKWSDDDASRLAGQIARGLAGSEEAAGPTVFERQAAALDQVLHRDLIRPDELRVIYRSAVFPGGSLSHAHDLVPSLAQKIRDCAQGYRYTEEMKKAAVFALAQLVIVLLWSRAGMMMR